MKTALHILKVGGHLVNDSDALEEVLSSSTKVMIDVEGGNNLLYLPLDQLIKKQEDEDE